MIATVRVVLERVELFCEDENSEIGVCVPDIVRKRFVYFTREEKIVVEHEKRTDKQKYEKFGDIEQ